MTADVKLPHRPLTDATDLAGRCLLASLFVIEGWNKLQSYAGSAAYMDKFGLPGQLLPLVIALEIGAGLMLAIGWQTRWAALALAIFSAAAAILFHSNFGDRAQLLQFEKNLALAGAFLVVAAHRPGGYSIDARDKSSRNG